MQGVPFGIFDSRQRDLENLVRFYLQFDQSLADALLLLEPRDFLLQLLDDLVPGVPLRLGAGLLVLQTCDALAIACCPPRAQVRAVDAFAAQQRAKLATLRAAISLAQDAVTFLRREAPSLSTIMLGRSAR